jgi:hypothetical protein
MLLRVHMPATPAMRIGFLGYLGIVLVGSCAQVSGLARLKGAQCVDSCDGGENASDAMQDDTGSVWSTSDSASIANDATANDAIANDATANDATANDATANDATANDATANDATANDATANDAIAAEATVDERREAADGIADSGPSGVRCGTGGVGTVWCNLPTRVCCQTTNGAGVATYACASSLASCGGKPILCASANDCAGGGLCCSYASAIKCEPSCPDRVCDPSIAGSCPPGKACNVSLASQGLPPPYLECAP